MEMTYKEAIEQLRYDFHKTRTTWKMEVDPEIIAAILGYNDLKDEYVGEEKLND